MKSSCARGVGPRRSVGSTPRGEKRRGSESVSCSTRTSPCLELGLWAAFEMYEQWGGAPGAGVIVTIGSIHGRRAIVVANDATVKAGACFPMTIKKILRAQAIARANRLPLVYLVDSSGVFLPLQDEVFPDEDDFGRIFRNNAVISAEGIPQYAAIMGNCVAGGAYLPVLCDTVLMTEGSGLYLAGPCARESSDRSGHLARRAWRRHVHAAFSGTIDYREPPTRPAWSGYDGSFRSCRQIRRQEHPRIDCGCPPPTPGQRSLPRRPHGDVGPI